MPFFESANAIAQMRLPFSGQVVGVVISSPANRSAGTLSAQVFNGSTSLLVGPAAVFDGTVANNATGNAAVSALIDIGAGQFYRLRLTPTGYAPLATSIKGMVYIALNNG
jgi:hypothetical protein